MKPNAISDVMLHALENLKEGVTITNPNVEDNTLIYVNNGYCVMTGYDKIDILGRNCRFLQGKETNQETVKELRTAIKNKENTVQEIVNYKKDGTLFWNRLSITHIFNNSKEVSYIIGIQEDITAKKEKEVLLREINNQKLINKTSLIAEEKQKREIGEELHDNVNQILATLKLYISVALNNEEKQTEMLGKSEKMIIYAMEEIRKLSKNLVGPSIKKETFQQAVSELIYSMQLALPFFIELIYDEGIEEDLSESMMITFFRIIQEQLNNIIKYANPNTVKIEFSMDDAMIYLSIKDDGVGFDKEITVHGIGLINMSHRVEMEAGNFTVVTSIGNGCEIKVDLPKAKIRKN